MSEKKTRKAKKVKKVSIFQSMMKALGYIPAPKTRSGKGVNVKPYVRKKPVKATAVTTETLPGTPAHDTI